MIQKLPYSQDDDEDDDNGTKNIFFRSQGGDNNLRSFLCLWAKELKPHMVYMFHMAELCILYTH